METTMRMTVLFTLGTLLIAGPMVQAATASEQIHQANETIERNSQHRGAYDQSNNSSAPLTAEEERNKEDFGFSGRSPSRPGGENPNLNPAGN
jgi:hypothetical protein